MSVSDALMALMPPDALADPGSEAEWSVPGSSPEVIVQPGSTEEVAAVMSWASAEGVGVLPVGSGRRVRDIHRSDPYIVLSTKRLIGVEIYEPADLTFTAASGTSLATIDGVLRANRQWMPFDPPHVLERTLGGLVAAGESGPLWMGYGELRNHVLGMTVVTGDGRTLRLGGRVVKNVAGYDVLKPMVGSRGALAVITAVCVRAFPEPAVDRLLVLPGESVGALVAPALAVGTAPVVPVSSVLVDRVDRLDAAAALVVRLHGEAPTVESDQAALERHVGVQFKSVSNHDDVTSAIRDHAADSAILVSILPSRLPECLAALDRLGPTALIVDTYAARIRVTLADVDGEAVRNVRDSIERLGGALRLEPLPGANLSDDLNSQSSAEVADLTSRLANVFDPLGVLWPSRGPMA